MHNRGAATDDNGNGNELGEREQTARKGCLTFLAVSAAGEKTIVCGGELLPFNIFVGK